MKAPTIRHSSWLGKSNVALVNLVKYSLTVSFSFCFQAMIKCESPSYLLNCMKFVKKIYFSCLKLYIFLGLNVLNHVPALPSKVVGKYVHQNRSSCLSDIIVHLYVSMWLSGFVVPF